MKRLRSRRLLALLSAVYLLGLHAIVAVSLAKSNLLLLVGKTIGWLPPEEWNLDLTRRAMQLVSRDRAAPAGSLVLIGDSIIENLDTPPLAPFVLNLGIGGDTTRTLLERLPAYRSLDQASTIVLAIGSNDLKYRLPGEIVGDYAAIIDHLPRAGQLIIVSTLPVNERSPNVQQRRYLRNASIAEINSSLRLLCEKRERCTFLDVWPSMHSPIDGGLHPTLHSGDGWHLSSKGNQMLASLIFRVVPR